MNSCGKRHLERDAALAEVRAVYSDLAARPIDRQCTLRTECCHFKLTGLTPFLTRGEALLAAKALRASGRKRIPDRKDGACPLLDPKASRCLIYEARPFGCRTHFCEAAGGPYSRREVLDLIRRLERVDAEVGGSGARPLPDAMAEGLRTLA
jgi:Fe-S-cluster containining protein